MKLYVLKLEMYDYQNLGLNTEAMCNAYSSFELAKNEGLKELKNIVANLEKQNQKTFKQMVDEELLDYIFEITLIEDIFYAENFNIKSEGLNHRNNIFSKLEPTHKIYCLDYKGNINEIFYEYRIKNSFSKLEYSIKLYPEDLEEGASEKFKIGDIVKLKEGAELDPFDSKNKNRIYVVRYLPRRFCGEIYFENKYALISLYENDLKNKWGNKELFTHEWYEKDIENYTGVIEKDSEYDLLSRILKGSLKVNGKYWNSIKIGKVPLNIETLKKENLIIMGEKNENRI